MDSSIYTYLIEDLRSRQDQSFAALPHHFITSPVGLTPESIPSLQLFIKSMITDAPQSSDNNPLLLSFPKNFFSNLFLDAHQALLDVISGAAPASHPYRHNGTQLTRFLSLCVYHDTPDFIRPADMPCQAMFCFLLEGLMCAGWCPNAFEGTAKRSAHSWLVILKKNLHFRQTGPLAPILGYLWGAWLLAQKTEGIRDNTILPFSASETFEWHTENSRRGYCVRSQKKPPVFYYFALFQQARISHPNSLMWNEGLTGLFLTVNNDPIVPETILDHSEIKRQKIAGHKMTFSCKTATLTGIQWTAVFLFFESTVYRIDVLSLPQCKEPQIIRGELVLESDAAPEQIANDTYLGKGSENMVIRFVENPLSFRFSKQAGKGAGVFVSENDHTSVGNTLKIVTAWAKGRDITTIQETRLLGIFE
jgi:hypothetical protein